MIDAGRGFGKRGLTLRDNQTAMSASITALSSSFWRGVNGRPAWTALAIESNFSTLALDVHLEDRGGVVDQTIDGCQRHCLIWEDTSPLAEWLIGCDQQRASLVAGGDQLEQPLVSA